MTTRLAILLILSILSIPFLIWLWRALIRPFIRAMRDDPEREKAADMYGVRPQDLKRAPDGERGWVMKRGRRHPPLGGTPLCRGKCSPTCSPLAPRPSPLAPRPSPLDQQPNWLLYPKPPVGLPRGQVDVAPDDKCPLCGEELIRIGSRLVCYACGRAFWRERGDALHEADGPECFE